MSAATAEVVICGAGIAGVAAAYHLAVRRGIARGGARGRAAAALAHQRQVRRVLPQLVAGSRRRHGALMNRSIDLMEELARESGNVFLHESARLSLRHRPARAGRPLRAAPPRRRPRSGPGRSACTLARGRPIGPRPPTGFEAQPIGTDVITEPSLIRRHFPYLPEDTVALLHARRCGWFSGQQLGMYMLERAREKGVRLIEGRVDAWTRRAGACAACAVSGRERRRARSARRAS